MLLFMWLKNSKPVRSTLHLLFLLLYSGINHLSRLFLLNKEILFYQRVLNIVYLSDYFFYFQQISNTLVNKCAAPNCKRDYECIHHLSKKTETLYFPMKKPDLNKQWIHFINGINLGPTPLVSFTLRITRKNVI